MPCRARSAYCGHFHDKVALERRTGSSSSTRCVLNQRAVPAVAQVDALHIGAAAANGVAVLVIWNCRHIANAEMRAKSGRTILELLF